MSTIESPLERLAQLPLRSRQAFIRREARRLGVTPERLKATMRRNWRFTGRPKQQAPEGDWTLWFIMAGRGFGKTLSGAQWAKKKGTASKCRFALIAPTLGDVRATMIEGETGLLSILPPEALLGGSRSIAYNKTNLTITLANGTIYQGFSSEEPDRLRGPQHHYAWVEEVSSLRDAAKGDAMETTFSNMKLGLRLGARPQACLTSTPKANKLTRELVALTKGARARSIRLVRGTSYENRSNLSEAWWEDVVAPLEGTRTGRQEIMAEVLDDVEGALWTRARIDALRVEEHPALQRVVVAVDPNVSSTETADSAGIIVVGLEYRRDWPNAYILADRTVVKGGPRAWAAAAVEAYHEFRADRIVAEVNNGGELVELTIRTVDPDVAYKAVHATRGKRIRAEPVSALYEGDLEATDRARAPKVHHVGGAAQFADLEDEMTTWVPGEDSPNRMDALVWGLTELMLDKPRGSGRTSVPKGRIPGVDGGRAARGGING